MLYIEQKFSDIFYKTYLTLTRAEKTSGFETLVSPNCCTLNDAIFVSTGLADTHLYKQKNETLLLNLLYNNALKVREVD